MRVNALMANAPDETTQAERHPGRACSRGFLVLTRRVLTSGQVEATAARTCCYCAATALEDGQAENRKLLSVGSSGSASRRRTVIIARAEPRNEIFPLSIVSTSPQ